MPDEPRPLPPTGTTSPVERATEAVMRLDLPDRLLLIGTSLAFLLGFLAWFSISSPFGGGSVNGYAGAGWLFGVASVATLCLMLVPTLRQAVLGEASPKNAKLILFGLAAGGFAFGPLRFLLSGPGGNIPNALGQLDGAVSAGKTMWFWLAFLASGSALGGAYLSLRAVMAPKA